MFGTNVGTVYVSLGTSIAGANQLTLSPAAIDANLAPESSPVTQTVTLSFQSTSQGSPTFSLFNTLPQSHLRDLADGTHVVASTNAGRRTGLIVITAPSLRWNRRPAT